MQCDPSNAHARTLFERTARATGSAPWQTTANGARPSSTRGAYLARFTQCSHSHAALPLSTIQTSKSSVSGRAARRPGATRPRRQRYVSVIVNLPHHNRAVAPKLPSAGSGPGRASGPLNKSPRVGIVASSIQCHPPRLLWASCHGGAEHCKLAGQVRSGQVRSISTRPKSETMRVTRQLGLPPRYRRA